MTFITSLGWFGTCLYLVNHSYISLKVDWKPSLYYGGNIVAAMALVFSSLAISSWQVVSINGFWTAISLLLFFNVKLDKIKLKQQHFYFCISAFMLSLLLDLIQTGGLNITVLGWLSAFLFSAGYLLFAIGELPPHFYFITNAVAATIMIPQLWVDQNIPVLALEFIWAFISVYGALQHYSILRLID